MKQGKYFDVIGYSTGQAPTGGSIIEIGIMFVNI